ncbi:allophanate hydrolase [Kineobactrum sediminis]|uniref:Allophanate hydrolase n=1 Tax=Kineobactrum sediminis TaxID=1905677 RepID=A0A2N5Y3X5_9GAMM|nr:biotin-dependent carboxyltransferase family protein [Kineobactrum sediminis]PLW83079.1 allophanate hydrolase [Kineobactrum sediminis]
MSLVVRQPGLLSLIQDRGRFGQHAIGLTNGGPLDPEAFDICQQLLGNRPDCTAIETSFGGLELEARVDTFICVTGASMPLAINGREKPLWTVHSVLAGDQISLGYAAEGCRSYLGVADGFVITPQFGSAATVVREKIGGINGNKLAPGDVLPCDATSLRRELHLHPDYQPRYHNRVTVGVIPGYQQSHFSRLQQRRFFSHAYSVSQRCDRMGYRLEGPAIECDINGILSEGICFGAIQIPADGQPIVLLNDRQTIGGYPKIGAALSLDAARLAQLQPGGVVNFTAITPHRAHNALHLAQARLQRLPLQPLARKSRQ